MVWCDGVLFRLDVCIELCRTSSLFSDIEMNVIFIIQIEIPNHVEFRVRGVVVDLWLRHVVN